MEKMPISSNMEDYLEAISEIVETNGHAHTKDIAARMKVKMPSVTNALQALASRGLIRYQSHAPVVLTQEGAQAAAVIRHRHGELRRFFHDDEFSKTRIYLQQTKRNNILRRLHQPSLLLRST